MPKVLIIIITRMHVGRGSKDDEFVNVWKQESNKDIEIFYRNHCDIFLLHGCEDLYNQGYNKIIKEAGIYDRLADYQKTIILYHGRLNETFKLDYNLHETEYKAFSSVGDSTLENIVKKLDIPEDAKNEILGIIPGIKISELAILIHSINDTLGPMDIEFQGIKELAREGNYILFLRSIKNIKEKILGINFDRLSDDIRNHVNKYMEKYNIDNVELKNKLNNIIDNINYVKEELKKITACQNKDYDILFNEYKHSEPKLCEWFRELTEILDFMNSK